MQDVGTMMLKRAGSSEECRFSLWGTGVASKGSLNVTTVCRYFQFDQGRGITINGTVVDVHPTPYSTQTYDKGAIAEVAGFPLQGANSVHAIKAWSCALISKRSRLV